MSNGYWCRDLGLGKLPWDVVGERDGDIQKYKDQTRSPCDKEVGPT